MICNNAFVSENTQKVPQINGVTEHNAEEAVEKSRFSVHFGSIFDSSPKTFDSRKLIGWWHTLKKQYASPFGNIQANR